MPRKYVRTTQRQNWSPTKMQQALVSARNGMAIRTAARTFNVPLMSLKRRIRNKNILAIENRKVLGSRITVFTPEQENELLKHILELERRMYGITTKNLRLLAFELAERNNIPHSFSATKKCAGVDWLKGFQKRHPELSLRIPEATSAARARAFNKPVVEKFFNLLTEVMQRYNLVPHKIFNVDETSLSTVPGRNSKILAQKGKKQVGRITSAERGVSTTAVICVSAAGSFVPPMLIYNRKRMKRELEDGAPPGTIFRCNDTGWMKLDLFKDWFDHFLGFVKPSLDDHVLLILDGHLSHSKNLDVILKARDNGVEILCLPPHTTHRLQPLDVAVMYPLSTYMDQALERWMNNHPGRIVTVFQISAIFCEAYIKAAVPAHGIKGFERTGIYPINPDVFTDADFAAAEVTDKPIETPHITGDDDQTQTDPENQLLTEYDKSDPVPGPSLASHIILNISATSSSFSVNPALCHPLPKQDTGNARTSKRKSAGNTLLTSTPYKDALQEEKKKKEAIEEKKQKKRNATTENNNGKNSIHSKGQKKTLVQKGTKTSRVIPEQESSSEEADPDDPECIFCSEYFSARGGDGWIRCGHCKKWAHDECAGVDPDDDVYVCDICIDKISSVKRRVNLDL